MSNQEGEVEEIRESVNEDNNERYTKVDNDVLFNPIEGYDDEEGKKEEENNEKENPEKEKENQIQTQNKEEVSSNRKKEFKKLKVILLGEKDVGKTSLINTLLREEVAKTSIGSVGTLETKEYTSKKYPFLKFIDTRGTELDSANNIYKVKENTLNYIEAKLSEKDPNKTIHCLFYCITGNRFEGIVKEVLLDLRKKYKNGNLPIIIVYTQNNDTLLFQKMKSYLK